MNDFFLHTSQRNQREIGLFECMIFLKILSSVVETNL